MCFLSVHSSLLSSISSFVAHNHTAGSGSFDGRGWIANLSNLSLWRCADQWSCPSGRSAAVSPRSLSNSYQARSVILLEKYSTTSLTLQLFSTSRCRMGGDEGAVGCEMQTVRDYLEGVAVI